MDSSLNSTQRRDKNVRKSSLEEIHKRLDAEGLTAENLRKCPICRIGQKDPDFPKHYYVYESPSVVGFLDRFPTKIGHILVAPKAHVESLWEMSLEAYTNLQKVVYLLYGALLKAFDPERIYVCCLGSSTQERLSYPHIHFHLLPIPKGDSERNPIMALSKKLSGVYNFLPEEWEDIASKIRLNLRVISEDISLQVIPSPQQTSYSEDSVSKTTKLSKEDK